MGCGGSVPRLRRRESQNMASLIHFSAATAAIVLVLGLAIIMGLTFMPFGMRPNRPCGGNHDG